VLERLTLRASCITLESVFFQRDAFYLSVTFFVALLKVKDFIICRLKVSLTGTAPRI
jgi:hypothetical protein